MDVLKNSSYGKIDIDMEFRESRTKGIVWSLVCAFFIIMLCSRSSFLYVFNLWDDANSYFTVGKCIFRGFVPYRDLFDQKGIMLYFIYGLSSLMSHTTFRGVFVFEVIAAFFSLWAILMIYQLFLNPRTSPYILMPLTGAVIYSSDNFWWGGSAEEFLFPFIMWGLFLSARHFRLVSHAAMSYKDVFLGGILAGCVFNIKFNSLGFFFGWMAMVFFGDLIAEGAKAVGKAFTSCFVFLFGMLAATIPWIIYFGVNGAIDDWMYVYIYKNVFEYSKKLTFAERAAAIYEILKDHFFRNEVAFILILVGIIYFIACAVMGLFKKDEMIMKGRTAYFVPVSFIELINLGVMFLFLTLVIFIGGVSLPYYSFPINAFVLFGFVPICYIIERFLEQYLPIAGFSFVLSMGLIWLLSVNVKVMGLKADELWLYRFRDYIVESGVEHPGIINQFSFDVGLYTVLDVEPICYYFQTQTLNMEEVLEYQKQYLHSGEADFVVTSEYEAEGIGDRYDLVMMERCQFYNFDQTYYLYQRNQNPAN